jgi:pyridinium-3,5-biscarboxylic acid mononucleotide sulfurtransferase
MEKLSQLRAWFEVQASVVVAYSGGVDSSLVMCVAHQVLEKNCIGVLAVSPSLPRAERDEAMRQAEVRGWQLQEMETSETDDPDYQANAPNRCFFCKDHVYRSLLEKARGLFGPSRWNEC